MDDTIITLLKNFLTHLDSFYKDLGVFTSQISQQEAAKEVCNRFYSNLVCLENYFILKDSLGSALMQRYNHELTLDFYYLVDPSDIIDKINRFFGYNTNSGSRKWSNLEQKDKRVYVPPWVADHKNLVSLYKKLSDMAHSNILSVRLNRRGKEFEYKIIQGAILLCIFEISCCINHKPFRDLFSNIKWTPIFEKNIFFQQEVARILSANKVV